LRLWPQYLSSSDVGVRYLLMTGASVALTGATGFVGRHILDKLQMAGIRTRLLVRNPVRLPPIGERTEVVEGRLSDPASLGRLVAGTSSVIHCAGAVRGARRAQFDRVNAVGAGECARMARDAGVSRFLLISSLAAREPALSPYAASKRGGEVAAMENAGSMRITILRPPAVYGPGDREMLPLFRIMARGLAPVFSSSGARFSLIFVEDLADAVIAWQNATGTGPGPFEIDDGRPGGYSWDDVCAAVQTVTGKRVRQIGLPSFLLGIPATFNTLAGAATGYSPMLTLGKLRELRHPDWVCRQEAGGSYPGWRPLHQLVDGLRKTPGWRN
jgi:nucleoside-diphosphate-sugar epimerase